MYRRLVQFLGNVSVNRKLSVSFGLVLVLTLLIAATGWNGLVSVIDRGDKLANLSKVIGLTKDLRIARLDYELQESEANLKSINEQLNELDTALEKSRIQLISPDDIALVQLQLAAVSDYRQALASLAQDREQSIARMHQQGTNLLDLSQKLSIMQAEKRDQDSNKAKRLLTICTVLALIVGIIAAWAITRQI